MHIPCSAPKLTWQVPATHTCCTKHLDTQPPVYSSNCQLQVAHRLQYSSCSATALGDTGCTYVCYTSTHLQKLPVEQQEVIMYTRDNGATPQAAAAPTHAQGPEQLKPSILICKLDSLLQVAKSTSSCLSQHTSTHMLPRTRANWPKHQAQETLSWPGRACVAVCINTGYGCTRANTALANQPIPIASARSASSTNMAVVVCKLLYIQHARVHAASCAAGGDMWAAYQHDKHTRVCKYCNGMHRVQLLPLHVATGPDRA